MKYQGQLYFEDDDVINVVSFIFREDRESLAFDIIASWGGLGTWRRSGVASRKISIYESDLELSYQVETGQQGVPCKLQFAIESESKEFLTVSGSWSENGEKYEFEGDLEPDC